MTSEKEKKIIYLGEVLLFHHLNVGLALSLLVLEVTVEKEDARVLDPPGHLGVGDVLVEHDATQHPRVLDRAAGDLLHLGVSLGVDLLGRARLGVAVLHGDGLDGVDGDLDGQVGPAGDELGADARLHHLDQLGGVVEVHLLGNLVTQDLDHVLKGLPGLKLKKRIALRSNVSNFENKLTCRPE